MEQLSDLLNQHYVNFPEMNAQDAVKFLYQHFMGPGHLISDEQAAFTRLQEEWDTLSPDPNAPLCWKLGNGLCRLNLSRCKADNLSIYLIFRIFALTVQIFSPNPTGLEASLEQVASLPLPKDEVRTYLQQYRADGCPMVSHSPQFRKAYAPAYRVVSEYYVNILPTLSAIDAAMAEHPHLRVAIDGPCASGKSTLGRALQEIYQCPLIHMDDFFLQPVQRTPHRLAEPGGNVDYERFYKEVLGPLTANTPFTYRPWLCSTGAFGPDISVTPAPLTVVEGSYSLHPSLRDAYQLRIWAHADQETRRRRLLDREGEAGLARFEQLWVPLEDLYFSACSVPDICQVHLDLSR